MTFTAADAAILVARALDFVREEPKNSNKGQAVRAFLKRTGLGEGYPWCAAFVAYVGEAVLGSSWPLPLTASCYELGLRAQERGILRHVPARGDVFLLHYPSLNRYAHTGFIVEVLDDGSCRTIEGNTNDGGSRDGWGVFERVRRFGVNDRFARWADVA